VVIDAVDPVMLSDFWRQLLGGVVDGRTATDEWVSLCDVSRLGYLSFQKVPEGRVVKNRVHLDLEVGEMNGSVRAAVSLGARVMGGVVDESTNLLQVMADPEGNEFCFIQRTPA
jgi:hypothetical protein